MSDRDDKRPAEKDTAREDAAAEDTPPIAPPPSGEGAPPSPPAARHFLFGALAVLALIAVAVAVVALQPQLRSRALELLDPGAGARADLAARVARLDGEIATLKSRPQPAPGADPARVEALAGKLAALEGAVEDIRNRPVPEAPHAAAVDHGAASLLALIAALDAGRPFAATLDPARAALAALGGDGARLAALDTLATWAATGVPTAAQLAARAAALDLSVAAPEKAAPAAMPEKPVTAADKSVVGGLWDRIKARLGSLVTIRRVDEGGKVISAPATPVAPDAAGAAALFARGDIAGGHARLAGVKSESLSPASRAALDALVADAAARLAADRVATGPVVAAAAAAPAAPGR
jgi:hypothetical protein